MADTDVDHDGAVVTADPEALLDFLAIRSMRMRKDSDDVSVGSLPDFSSDVDMEQFVRDFSIDDAISHCFADLPTSSEENSATPTPVSVTSRVEGRMVGDTARLQPAPLHPPRSPPTALPHPHHPASHTAQPKSRGFLASLLARGGKGRKGEGHKRSRQSASKKTAPDPEDNVSSSSNTVTGATTLSCDPSAHDQSRDNLTFTSGSAEQRSTTREGGGVCVREGGRGLCGAWPDDVHAFIDFERDPCLEVPLHSPLPSPSASHHLPPVTSFTDSERHPHAELSPHSLSSSRLTSHHPHHLLLSTLASPSSSRLHPQPSSPSCLPLHSDPYLDLDPSPDAQGQSGHQQGGETKDRGQHGQFSDCEVPAINTIEPACQTDSTIEPVSQESVWQAASSSTTEGDVKTLQDTERVCGPLTRDGVCHVETSHDPQSSLTADSTHDVIPDCTNVVIPDSTHVVIPDSMSQGAVTSERGMSSPVAASTQTEGWGRTPSEAEWTSRAVNCVETAITQLSSLTACSVCHGAVTRTLAQLESAMAELKGAHSLPTPVSPGTHTDGAGTSLETRRQSDPPVKVIPHHTTGRESHRCVQSSRSTAQTDDVRPDEAGADRGHRGHRNSDRHNSSHVLPSASSHHTLQESRPCDGNMSVTSSDSDSASTLTLEPRTMKARARKARFVSEVTSVCEGDGVCADQDNKAASHFAGVRDDVDSHSHVTSSWGEMTSVTSVCDVITSADESSYYSGDDDDEDDDDDEEEEDDVTTAVRLGVQDEDRDDSDLRHRRLQRHLEAVLRQTSTAGVAVETVVAATGERLNSQAGGGDHVNQGTMYPFSAPGTHLATLLATPSHGQAPPLSGLEESEEIAQREGRAPIRPARKIDAMTSHAAGRKGGTTARLFSPDRQMSQLRARQMTSDEFREGYDRSSDIAKVKRSRLDEDIPWDLLHFSDTDDDGASDNAWYDVISEEESLAHAYSTDTDSSTTVSDW